MGTIGGSGEPGGGAAFGETLHAYIVRQRLECARRLLSRWDRPVTAVCLNAGFESLGSFSSLFRRRFGLSPRQFRTASAQKSKS
ncbi:MAG TPA: helix-turn-helix transcriptional regulator [Vicinamibacteria bacterium]|jgi:AraC family transcriptional regulator|nr:helix-turn-helix transcriptional regulator [Vicinamibacteria bacterium]